MRLLQVAFENYTRSYCILRDSALARPSTLILSMEIHSTSCVFGARMSNKISGLTSVETNLGFLNLAGSNLFQVLRFCYKTM